MLYMNYDILIDNKLLGSSSLSLSYTKNEAV